MNRLQVINELEDLKGIYESASYEINGTTIHVEFWNRKTCMEALDIDIEIFSTCSEEHGFRDFTSVDELLTFFINSGEEDIPFKVNWVKLLYGMGTKIVEDTETVAFTPLEKIDYKLELLQVETRLRFEKALLQIHSA